MPEQVCLVTGVGGATGAAIVRRFAQGEYKVAMLARNRERLAQLEQEVEGSRAYVCDVGDLDALAQTIATVQRELGHPHVLVHNAVSATFATFMDGDPTLLERNFRVNTTSLLYLARALTPAMIDAGGGALIITGNTSALRGIPTYALFAPTKAAQRILAESLARDLGPKRIHVGYVTIDAAIDSPWLEEEGRSRPAWLEPPAGWKYTREEYFAHPDAIATEVFHLAHQHPSTWTFDLIIRPFAEKW